jgi:glycosyl transferase family 25
MAANSRVNAMTPDVFQPLNQYFDKIHVLSLPHATARHANIVRVLDGLNWSYFWGADKKDYSATQVIEQHIYDDVAHKHTKRTSRSMNLGEVACALSHRNIYQNMLDEGHKRILILEDDVLPQPEQLQYFDRVICQLPEDWELLMLGYYGHKPPTLPYRLQRQIYLGFHYLRVANWHKVSRSWIDNICMQPYSADIHHMGKVLGTHAYAVSASAAEKFVAYQTPVHLQADRIFNYYAAQHSLNAFALKNTFFTLSELASKSYIQ